MHSAVHWRTYPECIFIFISQILIAVVQFSQQNPEDNKYNQITGNLESVPA